MKQLLLTMSALIVAIAAQALPPRNADDFVKESQPWFEKARKSPLYADTDGIWQPGTISHYVWDSETNDWKFSDSVNYSYNELGQKIKVESSDGVVNYSYNEFGQIVKVESSDGAVNYYEYTSTGQISSSTDNTSKLVYKYDEVTDKKIGVTYYKLEDDQWVTKSIDEMRITRNEKGNITRIDDYYTNLDGELELAGYFVYNYGADDKINEIIEYYYSSGDGGFKIRTHFTDIVWENTDGQRIVDYPYYVIPVLYCMGENRIKSCTVLNYRGYSTAERDAEMKAEYTDNLGSMKVQITFFDTPTYIYEYSVLDENGSYSEYSEDFNYSVDGSTITIEDAIISKEVHKYDSYNNLIEYEYEYRAGNNIQKSKSIREVTYDPTYGYPIELIYKYSSNGGEMQNRSRTVYGDYALYAGVDSPEVDADAPVEYYNLQGIRVTNPSNGIYIRRQGKSISKVMVK